MIINTVFSNKNKYRNKNNYKSSYQKWAKVFSMSQGNVFIAESILEVLFLIWFRKWLV